MTSGWSLVDLLLAHPPLFQPDVQQLVSLFDRVYEYINIVLNVWLLCGLMLSDLQLLLSLEVQHIIHFIHVDLIEAQWYLHKVIPIFAVLVLNLLFYFEYVPQWLWNNSFAIVVYIVEQAHGVGFARACVPVNEDQPVLTVAEYFINNIHAGCTEHLGTAYTFMEYLIVTIYLVVGGLAFDFDLAAIHVSHINEARIRGRGWLELHEHLSYYGTHTFSLSSWYTVYGFCTPLRGDNYVFILDFERSVKLIELPIFWGEYPLLFRLFNGLFWYWLIFILLSIVAYLTNCLLLLTQKLCTMIFILHTLYCIYIILWSYFILLINPYSSVSFIVG